MTTLRAYIKNNQSFLSERDNITERSALPDSDPINTPTEESTPIDPSSLNLTPSHLLQVTCQKNSHYHLYLNSSPVALALVYS